jgi:hypothetical protein
MPVDVHLLLEVRRRRPSAQLQLPGERLSLDELCVPANGLEQRTVA